MSEERAITKRTPVSLGLILAAFGGVGGVLWRVDSLVEEISQEAQSTRVEVTGDMREMKVVVQGMADDIREMKNDRRLISELQARVAALEARAGD